MRNKQGFLKLLLFSLMEDRPRYGYDLLKAIEKKSGGYWQPGQGTVYGALDRLAEEGKIKEVNFEENGEDSSTRQYYDLTETGREEVEELRNEGAEEINPEERTLGLMYIYKYLSGKDKFELLLEEIQEEFFN